MRNTLIKPGTSSTSLPIVKVLPVVEQPVVVFRKQIETEIWSFRLTPELKVVLMSYQKGDSSWDRQLQFKSDLKREQVVVPTSILAEALNFFNNQITLVADWG